MKLLHFVAALICSTAVAGVTHAQASSSRVPADARPPYLLRGDEVETKYRAYRERLERFFASLEKRLGADAPDLRSALAPPAAVPYGYQILPNLRPEPPWKPRAKRVVLSQFSWSRTEARITRDGVTLTALSARLDSLSTGLIARRKQYESIVADYKQLVLGQKLMESQIQYNRQWQGSVARNPEFYKDARSFQEAALERQRLVDSAALGGARSAALRARAATLSKRIDDAIRKLPAPEFVHAYHPSPHRWILSVTVYTDIVDSAFVERFRRAIENGWHVRDSLGEFSVSLDIRRLTPAQLYPKGDAPAKGAHIDVAAHVRRFPADGAVLTSGANTIYSIGRAIIPGPHTIGTGALVHEFGHVLGFKDGYFRNYEDRGADGYEIIEVILDSEAVVAAPEYGRVRREHFEHVLREKHLLP